MSLALCYNKAKDNLYIGSSSSPFALFRSHDEKGYNHNRPQFSIPETNFCIKIESNFSYGNTAYLRASIWYNDEPLLNFHNWWDCLNYNLSYFKVNPTSQNWEELFNQIINVYNHKDSWYCTEIHNELKPLYDALSHPEKITVRKYPWLPPQTDWKEPLSVLHLARKSHELLNELEAQKLSEIPVFKDILISIFTKVIPLIPTAYTQVLQEKPKDEHKTITYTKYFEKYFDTIYTYFKRTNQLPLFFSNL